MPQIDHYFRKIEKESELSDNHLQNHDLKASFRARMVDWMCEVLNIAFQNICSDQTFFLAVSIMDRYIEALGNHGNVFKSSELHITGVTCMFIASKYEDVHPLLMKTVFNKIGHSKIPVESILRKEQDILRTIGFRIGGAPTPLEIIQNIIESEPSLRDHPDRTLLETIAIYLGKMSLFHEDLYTKSASKIASSSIFVSHKIYEQMLLLSGDATTTRSQGSLSERFLLDVLTPHYNNKDESRIPTELISQSKRLLALA